MINKLRTAALLLLCAIFIVAVSGDGELPVTRRGTRCSRRLLNLALQKLSHQGLPPGARGLTPRHSRAGGWRRVPYWR
ncbi:hypothetical protein NHF46_23705 [Arthrobacter alpinus]|nr:hypothetical protein [Arthrobacter alpinus]